MKTKKKQELKNFTVRFQNKAHLDFVRNELGKVNEKRRKERNVESVISCLEEIKEKIKEKGIKFI